MSGGHRGLKKIDRKITKTLLLALKIGIGSSLAIYIAEYLQLEFATSAGTIALLTLLTTKWETVRLSLYRLITFAATVCIAWICFAHVPSEWVAYGVFIFCLVILSYLLGWKATVSVNAVIGAHFLTTRDFAMSAVLNELALVVIGISVAIVLNLFNDNFAHKKEIVRNMRYAEEKLQEILEELAMYLLNQTMSRNVWRDIKGLESRLEEFMNDAIEYQDNTFQSHPQYYIDYFEMRLRQCIVLHTLHNELQKMRVTSAQAEVVAEYMLYLKKYVVEVNLPDKQEKRLRELFAEMEKEPLPVSREEFESRALLYHVLMDLEEFLKFKVKFVNGLDDYQRKRYWKDEGENL